MLYAPASLLLGTYIPAADDIEKLRWSAPSLSGVGEPAIWVHLIAVTAGLYIILPRLILTGALSLSAYGACRAISHCRSA